MEVTVRHIVGKRFEAQAGDHIVECDQPIDQGGGDGAMTPPELMLSALGCCAMHYATEYLRARNLPMAGMQVHVTAEKGGHPTRLAEIGIVVESPGLDPAQKQRLIRAVDTCLLHQTLLHPPVIRISSADLDPVLLREFPQSVSLDHASSRVS